MYHTSSGEQAATLAQGQVTHQRDNLQDAGGCAGITKITCRAVRSATASHDLL